MEPQPSIFQEFQSDDKQQFLDVQIILVFQLIHYLYFSYRTYKKQSSFFNQIGPTMILKSCLLLSFYIVFKKIKYSSNEFILGHLIIGVIFQIASLLYEKQFAQVVYQFTIMVQYSYFVQQMTEESIGFLCQATQYAQSLAFIYHLFQMFKNKNVTTLSPFQLKIHILESMLQITLSLTSKNNIISLGPGIVYLLSSMFCLRVQNELMNIKQEKKTSGKQKSQ
ncbi:unnamed protein product [Paramecium pentaurelia]|uniref:Transmembrane protein n=1 Tax=Paramecium pentaurelia TaxID=43138 RepID=A0A8S1W041_9CILI|nr:unnamed protein product [Paramecium pentaurelia]